MARKIARASLALSVALLPLHLAAQGGGANPDFSRQPYGIRAAKYALAFPEGASVKLVRRAVVSCSASSGCALVLVPSFIMQTQVLQR